MNLRQFYLLLGLLIMLSCVKTQELSQDVIGGYVVLKAPSGSTKTTLGTQNGEKIPVYWVAGDRINVNGVTSSPLYVADGQKIVQAEFQVNNVSLPYTVVYPSEVYGGIGEDGRLLLDIPAEQEYVHGSFGPGADILLGTSVEDAPVVMEHLCGTIKLSLTDAEASTITSLSLISLSDDHPIAGRFSLDFDFGVLSPMESDICKVDMKLPEDGVRLGPTATDFYFTIPSGIYPKGFEIRLEDSSKHILRMKWLRSAAGAAPGIAVTAGKVVQFASEEYAPDAREICSAEDWELFVQAYNNGGEDWKADWLGKDGSIKIGADISAKSLSQIQSLNHDIDACGYSITQTEADKPLIGTNRAEVRNLTLKGELKPRDPNNEGAAAFTSVLGAAGKFINCHNEMDIVITATEQSDVVAGAFVRSMQGGMIQNCTNSGDISVYSDINKKKDQKLLVAGFVAIVRQLTASPVIEGCVNNGNISVRMDKTSSATDKRPVNAGYAGIVANVIDGTSSMYLTVKNCVNNGNVSVSYITDPSAAQHLLSGVGGIIGLSTKLTATGAGYNSASGDSYYLVLEGCVNKGHMTNSLVSPVDSQELNKAFAGGIAGVVHGISSSHARILKCENYGKITCYEGVEYKRAALSTVCGGLIGCGAFIDMEECIVKSSSIGTIKRQSYAVSAGVGTLHQKFNMSKCKFYADLFIIRSKTYAENNWSLGFTLSASAEGGNTKYANVDGSTITDCYFGGTLTTNKEFVEFSSQETVFGEMETKIFTASDFVQYIASISYGKDGVTISECSYWNGQ